MTALSPMMEARAFRIWQYANPRDWDCSYEDIGAALGLDHNQVHHTIREKGWGGRICKKGRVVFGLHGAKGVEITNMKMGRSFDPNALDTVDLMSAGIFAGADE